MSVGLPSFPYAGLFSTKATEDDRVGLPRAMMRQELEWLKKRAPRIQVTRISAQLKIVTFNINGIHQRLPNLLEWIAIARPDVVCLQELRILQNEFPVTPIREAGYGAIWQGQATRFNGVAILARGTDPVEVRRALPGAAKDSQARYIEAAVGGILIGCLYAPNGNPVPGPKFDNKLIWLEQFVAYASSLLATGVPVVLAGDYNIVPTDRDIYATRSYDDNALVQPESRAAYRQLLDQGWVDAVRTLHPSESIYTFWDYRRKRWERNAGLRIDHLLLSTEMSDRLAGAGVDREVRGRPGASDHAPTWATVRKARKRAAHLLAG